MGVGTGCCLQDMGGFVLRDIGVYSKVKVGGLISPSTVRIILGQTSALSLVGHEPTQM